MGYPRMGRVRRGWWRCGKKGGRGRGRRGGGLVERYKFWISEKASTHLKLNSLIKSRWQSKTRMSASEKLNPLEEITQYKRQNRHINYIDVEENRPAPHRHNTMRTDAIQCEKPSCPAEVPDETCLPHAGADMFKSVYIHDSYPTVSLPSSSSMLKWRLRFVQ